ncbi:E3 ubiquitin-protein ligase SDIR1 [Marchantia polymorpha subsp. ruderalis]|uniref:RING-type E3 ubiquitin transferase n=2 Tax=Marchantia polymorpha TaxID=3197 RepID=A0A176WCP9_MARPO|nr:hypothetical protein AXG93_2121s1170 [Marchantia polymorpha subsp. ruderalis]PTQ44302.1 hypothetical protein MARPO_0021s0149 [Marchantia polymorpha]BBN01376.1 hypothetical protein Mp_2g06960 [Marchantia polymorpha subsp. ruderalis]|eukprot:PTQ44302.1 hypothetical protein MARPO_0021s0149 [Marchantia polymorpha]
MDRARSLTDVAVDTAPLLSNGSPSSSDDGRGGNGNRRGTRVQGAARYLRRASSSRLMREPSMLVRESAAEQLEERQSDWAYSRPVVVLDLIWNLAFVVVAFVVLILSKEEHPRTLLRLWVLGYALQCILHMLCVCCEYRRRCHQRRSGAHSASTSSHPSSAITNEPEADAGSESDEEEGGAEHASMAKRLESLNTMFSFVWWIIGFYWITAGGQALTHDAPRLYWLCVVFLAFDVFFVVFCVALACVIGIAVCCCLPCIIAILYAVADQEGATEEDINSLPKYKFRRTGHDKSNGDKSQGGIMSLVGPASEDTTERALSPEDAECCICLSAYDDGVELRLLPCTHHFHCVCIDKWLRINATCPLCKFNIIHGNNNNSTGAANGARREEV